MIYSTEKVLIIELNSLPEPIQVMIKSGEEFIPCTYDKYFSGLEPFYENETWAKTCNKEKLEFYYNEQTKENNFFEGSLEEFIEEYNLQLDSFLINEEVDLKEVTSIFIHT